MTTASAIHLTWQGALVAVVIAVAIVSTLWWMLHPPASFIQRLAKEAESSLQRMVGSIIVVFSPEIASAHMTALAARLARGLKSELLAMYVIEVPYTLPPNAEMLQEERAALDALGAAEAIALNYGVDLRTEIVKTRVTSQAVLDWARDEKANMIVMGSFREGKYTGAPLGRTIEIIAAEAKCDVLIGIEGKHGTLLVTEAQAAAGSSNETTPAP